MSGVEQDPRGLVIVRVRGQDWRLWMSLSVLADVQAQHGQDCLSRLDPPAGAGADWLPPLEIVRDLLMGSLQRYHADEADRWLADEIFGDDPMIVQRLILGSFPLPKPDEREQPRGNAKARRG